MEADGELVLYLPRALSPDGEDKLRLRLETSVFGASEHFRAEVFSRVSGSLPQAVEGGDASEELGTDQLRVLVGSGTLESVLSDLEISPAAFTPQGDGINAEAAIRYTLFSVLDAVEIEVELLTLAGQRVRTLSGGVQGAGRHELRGDGRDDSGATVPPGHYAYSVSLNAGTGEVKEVGLASVAY